VDASAIDTNIVIFEVAGLSSAELARRTDASGVRLHAIAPTRLRAVTHLDVDAAGIDRAIAAVRAALSPRAGS
jgi:threonine aldolase